MQQSWIQWDVGLIVRGAVTPHVRVAREHVVVDARVPAMVLVPEVAPLLVRAAAVMVQDSGAAPMNGDSCALLGSPYQLLILKK